MLKINRECQLPTQRLYSISSPDTYGDRLRFTPAYPTSVTPTVTLCRRMCVGRKKCVTLLYNILISIAIRAIMGLVALTALGR